MNKYKVVGSTVVDEFQRMLNQETWYDIADVEISLSGYAMAIMVKRTTESLVTDLRYLCVSRTDYPGGLEQALNDHPDYEMVDGEIFGTSAETNMVVISRDNGTGGGSGTTDYELLTHLPKINGYTLIGDKDAASLELALNAEGQIKWWWGTFDPTSMRYFYDTVNDMPRYLVDDYLVMVRDAVTTSGDTRKATIPYKTGVTVQVLECDLLNPDQLFFMVDYLAGKYIKAYIENVGTVAYVRIASGPITDYSYVTNKPKINNVELVGNQTHTNLGLEPDWKTKHNEFVANYGSITLKDSPITVWATWMAAHTADGHYPVPYTSDMMVEAWVNNSSTYPLQFFYNGFPWGKNATTIKKLIDGTEEYPPSVQEFLLTGVIDAGTFI